MPGAACSSSFNGLESSGEAQSRVSHNRVFMLVRRLAQVRSRLLRALAWGLGCAALVSGPGSPARGLDLRLLVQPVAPAHEILKSYRPLTDYLEAATGHRIDLSVAQHALAHWRLVRDPREVQLVIDEPHFADYRVKRAGFRILARVSGLGGYSVVTRTGVLLIEPGELSAKPVATLPAPALGAIRLLGLVPGPVRAPVLVEADSHAQAVRRLAEGVAVAAVLPSAMALTRPDLSVVVATEDGPGMAFSAAPSLDAATRRKLARALLEATSSDVGRRALSVASLPGFEPASETLYDGYGRWLRGTWGYEDPQDH